MENHFYTNKKNSQVYEVLFYAMDATDGDRCGKSVVVYKNEAGAIYTRDLSNFMDKFERLVVNSPITDQ